MSCLATITVKHGRSASRSRLAATNAKLSSEQTNRYCSTRMQGGFLGFRGIATSSDSGATWSALEIDRQLPCPKCQGSLIRYDAPNADSLPRLLFSNPHPPTSPDGKPSGKRVDLTIRMSLDEGKTWPITRLLHRGPAAYSSLASLPDGSILCLYEGGETSSYQTLRFARFNLAWLTD